MKKEKFLLFSALLEIMLIISVALANVNPTPVLYFIFYNLMYGVLFSFLVPLWYVKKERASAASLGVKKPGVKQYAVLIVFAVLSVGGQLLFAVGLGFGLAYKLSDNNLIVSYFVNLPNAFVTYMLKYDQFPAMGISSTVSAIITIILILIFLLLLSRSPEQNPPKRR